MNPVIVLDTGPLGLITNPNQSAVSLDCTRWLQRLDRSNIRIVIPEIADYELRRELLRANKSAGIARLETLIEMLEYLPLTTDAMRRAAMIWAQARQQGQPTAGDNTIDCDVILAAQSITIDAQSVVATTNAKHIARFTTAELWSDISV